MVIKFVIDRCRLSRGIRGSSGAGLHKELWLKLGANGTGWGSGSQGHATSRSGGIDKKVSRYLDDGLGAGKTVDCD